MIDPLEIGTLPGGYVLDRLRPAADYVTDTDLWDRRRLPWPDWKKRETVAAMNLVEPPVTIKASIPGLIAVFNVDGQRRVQVFLDILSELRDVVISCGVGHAKPGCGFDRIAQIDHSEVENVFYLSVFVQSLGGGMLGGYMTEGRLSSGVRYGFVLVLVTFFVFKILF
jgi:hypothetical protein